MNRYVKGKVEIHATEKAYKILYKEQGYIPYKEIKTAKNTKKKEEADNS